MKPTRAAGPVVPRVPRAVLSAKCLLSAEWGEGGTGVTCAKERERSAAEGAGFTPGHVISVSCVSPGQWRARPGRSGWGDSEALKHRTGKRIEYMKVVTPETRGPSPSEACFCFSSV